MARIFLCPSLALAREFMASHDVALTVEAEYGAEVVEGRRHTAAHHQPKGYYAGRHLPGLEFAGAPSPCNDGAIPLLGDDDIILVSHLDLDTIGGCLRAEPAFQVLFGDDGRGEFWDLAEWVDTRGPHRLEEFSTYPQVRDIFWAYRAWSASIVVSSWKTETTEVTDVVRTAGRVLDTLLQFPDRSASLIRAGRALQEEEEALNTRSLVAMRTTPRGVVLLRECRGQEFVNGLYRLPLSVLSPGMAIAVVAYNATAGTVTISFADTIPGESCREIVQALWGPEAGGHPNIAGSPRGRVMSSFDAQDAMQWVCELLS